MNCGMTDNKKSYMNSIDLNSCGTSSTKLLQISTTVFRFLSGYVHRTDDKAYDMLDNFKSNIQVSLIDSSPIQTRADKLQNCNLK